jgi:peptide/nickel transport system permease protein
LLKSSRLEFLLRAGLDFLSALPGFLIALAFGIFLPDAAGPFLLGSLLLAAPTLTRFFESQLRHLRFEPYIQAAEALGAGPLHLWIRHYQPELLRMLRAILPFLALRLILLETSLGFLGLQQVPEHETWGRMLHQGKDYLIEAPWILHWAAVPLALTLASFHLLSREDPQ